MVNWDKYEGYREVTAYPSEFSGRRFEIPLLWKAVEKAEILFRGWPFIYVDRDKKDTYVVGDSIQTIVELTGIRPYEQWEMWQLKQSGLFFHRSLMDEETYAPAVKMGKVLSFEMTVYHVSEAIGSLWRLYAELGVPDKENVTIKFIYKGVEGRQLATLQPMRMGFRGSYDCHSQEVTVERILPLETWRSSDVDIATEISCEIFQQFQWIEPNKSEIGKLVSNLLAK